MPTKFELPVVAKTTVCGVPCEILAIPYGLLRAMQTADSNDAKAESLVAVVRRCVRVAGSGEAVDPEELPAAEIARLATLALPGQGEGAKADFPTPPGQSATGGSDYTTQTPPPPA